jgi:hypothetical protein
MQGNTKGYTAGTAMESDEELHDILIAISVVAKRLASKIEKLNTTTEGESQNG